MYIYWSILNYLFTLLILIRVNWTNFSRAGVQQSIAVFFFRKWTREISAFAFLSYLLLFAIVKGLRYS